MGKIKDVAQDWLENCGYDLGYDMTNLPDMSNWNVIRVNQIEAYAYYNNKQVIEQEDLRIKYGAPEPPEVEDE